MRIWAAVMVAAVTSAARCEGTAGWGAWTLAWGEPWSVKGDFSKGKDLSAAAGFGMDQALVASDETRGAQRISLDPSKRVLTVHDMVPLLPGKGSELDLEGAAASVGQRAYFLVGSQALSRTREAFEADRGYVFKLPVDASGRPQAGAVARANLRSVLSADKELAPFLNRPADDNGLDIEGLAEWDGRLFFGLRAPVVNGEALVLEAGVDDLFAGKGALTHHRLAFGRGRGIRDVTALAEAAGFLVLVGPSGGPDSAKSDIGADYELWHWSGPGAAATRLGALGAAPGEPEAKAEAVLVLSQSPAEISGLILHDGPKNGAPHGFRLSPPAAK